MHRYHNNTGNEKPLDTHISRFLELPCPAEFTKLGRPYVLRPVTRGQSENSGEFTRAALKMTIQRLMEFIGNHPVLTAAFAAVLTFIVINEVRRKSGSREIGPKDAVRLINDENAIMLDIRESADYKAGHIINAKNLPLSRLDGEAASVSSDKNRPIIIYCKSGMNSQAASSKLQAAGYARVYCLKNGLFGWQEENLPVEK